jgi:hypothetical protein
MRGDVTPTAADAATDAWVTPLTLQPAPYPPPAPKFNVVCQPNDWARSLVATAAQLETAPATETEQMQLEFWTQFAEHLQPEDVERAFVAAVSSA